MSGVNIPVKITKKYSFSTLGLNPRWCVCVYQPIFWRLPGFAREKLPGRMTTGSTSKHPFFQGRKNVKTFGFRGVPKVFFTIEYTKVVLSSPGLNFLQHPKRVSQRSSLQF